MPQSRAEFPSLGVLPRGLLGSSLEGTGSEPATFGLPDNLLNQYRPRGGDGVGANFLCFLCRRRGHCGLPPSVAVHVQVLTHVVGRVAGRGQGVVCGGLLGEAKVCEF